MINVVVISGIVKSIYNMTNNVVLADVYSNNEYFTCLFVRHENNAKKIELLKDTYIIASGELTHIKYIKENNEKATSTLVIKVNQVDGYEF